MSVPMNNHISVAFIIYTHIRNCIVLYYHGLLFKYTTYSQTCIYKYIYMKHYRTIFTNTKIY